MAERILVPPPRWAEGETEPEPTNEDVAALIAERLGRLGDLPPVAVPTYEQLPAAVVPAPRPPSSGDITGALANALRQLGFLPPAAEPTVAPQVAAVDELAIRDVAAHTPETDPEKIVYVDQNLYEGLSLLIVNNLDQAVEVTPYGHVRKAVGGAVAQDGAPIVVAAGATDALTMTVDDGWLPWRFLSVAAQVEPAAGALTVTAVRFRKMKV